MSRKQTKKTIFSNSIVKNLLLIILCSILLIILALLLLNVYTRHGQNVVVPSLENLQLNEANTILRAKGLHAEIVDSIYQRDALPGAILDQRPKAGNRVKEGRAIYLTIFANSPQMVAVPELTDYSTRQASALLNSIGFTQLTIREVPAEYSGLVVAVEYRGKKLVSDEKIPAGSPLTLIVTSNSLEENIVPPEGEINNHNMQANGDGAIDDSFF